MINISDLQGIINSGEKILVGVSGGMDSMALLHRLCALRDEGGFTLAAVSVDHNLRGEEGRLDVALVKKFCAANKVEFFARSVDVMKNSAEKGFNVEQEARKLRYEAFAGVQKDAACDKLATAHHALDNAETVLLNLFRGSGARGAAGIEKFDGGTLIRPLIDVSKDDIVRYVYENAVPYRDDASNEDTAFSRNFIRKEVMPLVSSRFGGLTGALNRFAQNAQDDEDLIVSLLADDIQKRGNEIFVPLYYYNFRALGKRASDAALAMLGAQKDMSAANYDDIRALASNTVGSRTLLPNDAEAVRDYAHIVFSRDEVMTYDYEIPYSDSAVTLPTGRIAVRRADRSEMRSAMRAPYNEGERPLYADAGSISMSAVWRTRREGDMIIKFGGGTKKLNDYLNELKIPSRMRDSVPLLCSGNKVLLIAGYEISERLRVEGEEILAINYTKTR